MYSLTFRVRVNPCTDCKSAQQSTTRGHPLPVSQDTFGSVQ